MPNMCAIDIKIAGKEEAVKEMVQMLSRTGPFGPGGLIGLGRVFDFNLDETFTERDPKDPTMLSVQGFGDCANSIKCAIIDWAPHNLESECKRLGVVVEAFSSEPGNQFQEHFLCNKGVIEVEECVDYEEWVLSDMHPSDIETLAKEKDMTVDELWSKVNDNGEYTIGGFDNYCDFQDLFSYFEPEKEDKFIISDAFLVCQDPHKVCVNAYVWAMEHLVEKLKQQQLDTKRLTSEEAATMENINFYADYNVQKKQVSMTGSYYFYKGENEEYQDFTLRLSEEETAELIAAIEAYSLRSYGKDCLSVVDEHRREDGLMPVLDYLTLIEKLKTAETIEYKGITFDEWTVDEETGGIYGEMCRDCAAINMDLIKDELDDGSAIGACSVKGCSVIGAENGDAKHYYIDFKPELIKVQERKPSLDALCADAEARCNTPHTTQENSHHKESER